MIEIDAAEVRALRGWMDDQGHGDGPIDDVEAIGGGTQNRVEAFRRGSRRFVLRRPPAGGRRGGDETMRRESVVLGALRGTRVPHPELLGYCPPGVLDGAFYVMAHVDGFNPGASPPAEFLARPRDQRDLADGVIDALAALAAVDPDAPGVSALGRRADWIARQPVRWATRLGGLSPEPGCTACSSARVARITTWLDEHRPTAWRPGLVHGDFHLANVLVRRDRPQVAAVVDWELATIGDPLLDLAHLIVTWPTPTDRPCLLPGGPWPDLPPAGELVERYVGLTGRDVAALPWYVVLACLRLAALLEGTVLVAGASGDDDRAGRFRRASTSLLDLAARPEDLHDQLRR